MLAIASLGIGLLLPAPAQTPAPTHWKSCSVIGDAMAGNLKKDTYAWPCSEAWFWRRTWKWPMPAIY